jgi:hypothetical protein
MTARERGQNLFAALRALADPLPGPFFTWYFKRECSGAVSYSYLDELYLTEQQRRMIRGEDLGTERDAGQSLAGESDTSLGGRQASAGSGCLGVLLLTGMTLRHLGTAANMLFKRRKQ